MLPKYGLTVLFDQNCGVQSGHIHTDTQTHRNTHTHTNRQKCKKLRDLRSCQIISLSSRLWSLAVQDATIRQQVKNLPLMLPRVSSLGVRGRRYPPLRDTTGSTLVSQTEISEPRPHRSPGLDLEEHYMVKCWPSGKLPFECQKIAKNLTL